LSGSGNRIAQGGGYLASGLSISRKPPIPLEYKLPNARGTLAMARTSDLNSATSEWFFNVDDNSTVLGATNGGGYAVFARVIGTGMSVVDAIAALPNYNAGGVFTNIPLRDVQAGQTGVLLSNLILVNSITAVPLYPADTGSAVLSFSASSSAPAVASASIANSNLVVSPISGGTAVITVRATDTNGNAAETSFVVNVSAGPVFSVQPESRTVSPGDPVVLSAVVNGAISYQWQRNGVDLPGATGPTLTVASVQPSDVGVYFVRASDGSVTRTSDPAILALVTTNKVVGSGTEVGPNIVHSNGTTYDQILLTGPAATMTADVDQVARMSFIDLNDDIVQVEFSGAGAVTVSLDNFSGPAAPAKYNQSNVAYVKGRATIVVGGADESTNLTVFTVGRSTAVNQALFRDDVTYDGVANLALVAVLPPSGNFGGLRTSDASYAASGGLTGVYAPRVRFAGPLYVGDINAADSATATIICGNAADVRITGGDLQQDNARAVQVDGMTRIQFTAGTDSHGNLLPQQPIRGRLEKSGVDVTASLTSGN
jgi:cyclophilin family peptidyl-prolyl cis-trans isomerase